MRVSSVTKRFNAASVDMTTQEIERANYILFHMNGAIHRLGLAGASHDQLAKLIAFNTGSFMSQLTPEMRSQFRQWMEMVLDEVKEL